jgi:hypothetical protein
MHTAEPLVHKTILFKAGLAVKKFKIYKSPGNDQIPVELIQAGGNTLCS